VVLNGAHDRLPCGVDQAAVLAQIAEGAGTVDLAHQAECPYCRAAVGRIDDLWSDVRALADVPVRAPRDLLADVSAHAVGPAGAVTLRDATGGHTEVGERVLAGVARKAAESVPEVAYASVLAHAAGPGRVVVRARLVTAYGPSLVSVAAAVADEIVTHVRRMTGVEVLSVDVSVDDLAVSDA